VVPPIALAAWMASVAAAHGMHDPIAVYASLTICTTIAGVCAGIAFYLRWRLTGEAALGLVAAALVTMALTQLPLALFDSAVQADDIVRRSGPIMRAATAVPATWLIVRALRAPEVVSPLRPGRLAVICSTLAGGLAVLLEAAIHTGLMPALTPLQATMVDLAMVGLAAALAVFIMTGSRSLQRPVTTRLAAAFVILGAGSMLLVAARLTWSGLWVAAGLVQLMGVLVVTVLATSMLRSVLDFQSLRMLALSLRAQSAEETVREEQERMHELRTTVAGIRKASGTLHRKASRLEPAQRRQLEHMMAAELGRLERLLTRADAEPVTPVAVDDVLRPLVVAEREWGAQVRWEPSGHHVLVRADEFTEILHVLLVNARQHAAHSPVTVSVEADETSVLVRVADAGPGIADEPGDLFERGRRGAESNGQGLGLHIAQRLAHRHGGTLTAEVTPGQVGACFVLTLPRAGPHGSQFPVQPDRRGELP
jgi:signal transduction histidine kinase